MGQSFMQSVCTDKNTNCYCGILVFIAISSITDNSRIYTVNHNGMLVIHTYIKHDGRWGKLYLSVAETEGKSTRQHINLIN